jgi:hypothetical protein
MTCSDGCQLFYCKGEAGRKRETNDRWRGKLKRADKEHGKIYMKEVKVPVRGMEWTG